MMKFKKFLAATMTSAMMFSTVAMAVPAVSAYAETSVKTGTSETMIFHAAARSGEVSTGGAITAGYYCDPYDDGIPYLTIDDVSGNYITVEYYGKPEGAEENKGLKSSVVYTRDELDNMGWRIPLTGLNLKSGASFKVYGENDDTKVTPVVIAKQDNATSKLKVKVKDFTRSTLLEVMEISVGGSTITADAKYIDKLLINNMPVFVEKDGKAVENEELLPMLKQQAKIGGGTFYLKYFPSTDTVNLPPVEAKFKIAAAPKAPKVTIDYVNGGYTIPGKTSYVIAGVNADGIILPTVTPIAVEKKESLTISQIVSGSAITGATGYAIIVESAAKGAKMGSTIVLKVPELDTLTVSTPSNNSAELKIGGTKVGTITYTEKGVKIKADGSKDIMYWNTSKGKFETVKSTKESKEIAFTGTLRVKVAGTKAKGSTPGAFGSMELPITNAYVATPPAEQ